MERKGRGKKHRICAAFLCICMLFSLPGIADIFPVVAAAEQDESFQKENIIMAFDSLSENIKEQAVFIGTDLDELNLPRELTVSLLRESAEESEQESTEQENNGETDKIEENSDTETKDEQGTQAEETDETTVTDSKDAIDTEKNEEESTGESVPLEEQGGSENGQDNAPSEEQPESTSAQETHTVTMPEYLSENVISVQTLENTQIEKQEETVTISGITWQSEPEYDGNIEGTYIFTAILPGGYILAEGVSLPEITVTVGNGIDAIIQTLRDRIAALPDVEEYLALEPDEEAEDAYAEWEEKLHEYAEEALAIWEEYEALTEEQQAQITEEELAKLTAWVEVAETLSDNNAVMLADNSEHHGESDWTALTTNDTTLTNGKYYLSGDIEMGTITINDGDVMLCLNGQTLTHSGDTGSVIVVNSGTFTLCDCENDTGCITGGKGELDGNSLYGGGIYVCKGARLIMRGGTIRGNTAKYGGGISIGVGNNNAGTYFTMSGGVIEDNTADSQGGGIFCGGIGEMTITNGVIRNNTANSRGAGIFAGTAATVNLLANGETDKVSICGNKVVESNGNGGGYTDFQKAILKIEGNVNITGNKRDQDENNIALLNGRVILLTDKLTGSFGVTTWNAPYSENNTDVNNPYKTTVQGADGYEVSSQDLARISSDNTKYSVLMIEGKIVNGADEETGKVLVLGNEDTGNLSGMDLSIKDGSSGEEIKLSPKFAEKIYEYSVIVPNSVKAVSIVATPKNADAAVAMTIQNADNATDTTVQADNILLAEGENTIKVNVTEGDASKVYIVTITREAPAGNPVTITAYKDGAEWKDSVPVFKLISDNGSNFVTDLAAVPDGTYSIYYDYDGATNIDTGKTVNVNGAPPDDIRVDYFTVTFYDGGKVLTSPAQQIVLEGAAASAPADNPTKTGYTFSKWVTADGGSTGYDFTNETVTGKTLVYASWTPVTYTITYDLAGGTLPAGKTNPADYTIETEDITLQNPECAGYTFAGWSGTGLAADSTTVTIAKGSTGNRKYTANWTAKTYGITLNGNGGTGDDLTGYTYGQGAALPVNWTKTGYTFAGWYDNKDCTGTPITEVSATDTGDKTFWAKWTPQTYQVTFEYYGADGGDTTASKNVTYAGKYGTLPVPSRTGYTFKGWYTAEAEGQGTEVNAETTVTTASAHTLHARWKDETAPDKPVLQDNVTLPTDWTNAQDKIPLKLYDGVGVTELWVSVDGKGYIKVDGFSGGTGSMTYDYTPVLEGEREPGKGHTYQFKAVDAAGNFSESDTFTVKLDQTKPMIGTLTYENKVTTLWNWIIGKTSMVIHVPVTDTGSGVTEIRYTLTPKDAAGNPDASQAVEKTATVRDGKAKITFDKDFRGTIAITCTDAAGNAADGVTIDTAGTGGVIVEDHAPDITILADRNPADLQQTQQNGVAVSEGYYTSVPALLVTVKDDTGNAITAGIAAVTYQVEGSEGETVTVDGSTLQEQVSFTIPAAQIPTGVTEIKVTATDNAGNTAEKIITIKVKGPEKQPAAEIDYRQEKLTGLVPCGEYLIDGETYTADQEGRIPIEEDWLNSSLNIIKKGNGSETSDSPAQNLSIPARPAAPNPLELNTRTENSITLKTITGAQYRRTDRTGNWQDSTVFEGLNPKTIYYFKAYYPATDTSFASPESSEAEIATMPTPPTPDQLGINYEAETLALANNIEAFSDRGCTTPVTTGSAEDYMGATVYIRYQANGIIPASATTPVSVPERTPTPTPGITNASYPKAEDGKLTGLTAGGSYMLSSDGGSAWQSRTANESGEITGLKAGTYKLYVAAGSTNFRSETATVTVGAKPATKYDTPAIQIDYDNRTLTGFEAGGTYHINGEEVSVRQDGTIEIDTGWFGTTLSIIRKGNDKDKTDSDAQSLFVPTIPPKPTPAGVDVSTAGGTGKLTGLTAGTTYELSTDGGRTWKTQSYTADGSGEITGLAPGTYVVRVKAGASNFASEPSESATIGAYKVTVIFMVDGTVYKEIPVDYGTTLKDIPSVPGKNGEVGEWCVDAQGSSLAEFTNIIADMTVYAVYTTAYTVTLQSGTGYALSAVNDSKSPVKEGGSFTFRFELKEGYHRVNGSFAVTVNGAKVELTNDAYTITDIRGDQIVRVMGVEKDADNPSGGGGDNEDDEGGSQSTPTQPPINTTTPTPTPQPTPGSNLPVTKNESEGRKQETTPEPEETHGSEEPENSETQLTSESLQTQIPDTTPASQTYTVGKGTIIVTLNNVDETVCTARVAEAADVAHAVLSEEELAEVEQGQIIEIRIDVERLENVPECDAEVIEGGIEDCKEQNPGIVMGMYVDISMYMRIGSGDWNAIHATNEPVEIILDVPDELAGLAADFYIMRAHEGEYLLMEDLDEAPETITIQTEAFSTYAILYQMQESTGGKPAAKCSLCHICPTFLGICYFIWLAVIIVLALVIYLILWRKRKEEESEEQ